MASPPSLLDVARDPSRPRILIARTSAIGDTILTTPVACQLRRALPDAYLAWMVEEKSSCFVQGHPALDDVVVAPRGWFVSPAGVRGVRRRLRALRLDATLDCQGLTKTALAGWLSGAPLRVGFRGEHGREFSPWLNNRRIEPAETHLTDRSLSLIDGLGLTGAGDAPVEWRLPRDTAARRAAAEWLGSHTLGCDHGRPYAVINPGASWDSKLWENERFAQIARRLLDDYGLPTVVVWGGERERGWAEQIAARSGGAAIMGPPTSLQELAEIVRAARLVVSPDTGPMHLAVAVGTPTVGLFGVTRPEDCGPYGAPHAAVQRRYQGGGRKQRRQADNAAMREITVDDAAAACDAVLLRTADPADNQHRATA